MVVPDLLCLECELVSVIDALDFDPVLILCTAYLSILTFCFGIRSGLLPRSSPSACLIDLLVSDIVAILCRTWVLISHCADDTVLMALPELYRFGREGTWFGLRSFIIYMLDGVYQVCLLCSPVIVTLLTARGSRLSYISSYNTHTSRRLPVLTDMLWDYTNSQQ
jgi:hypothetical protein